MSMSPIVETIQGQERTFLLTSAALDATLTADALAFAFRPQIASIGDARIANPSNWNGGGATTLYPNITQRSWANMLGSGTDASTSQIPREQIVAIIRESLIGGGMATADAVNVADTLRRNQVNREVDYLAAEIVNAALDAV